MKPLLNKLRNTSFWMTDLVKGGKIRSHYKDIQSILENYDSKESSDKRAIYVSNLLKHATQTSPFYQEYRGFKSLSDFPVINKLRIIERFDDLQSRPYKNTGNHAVHTSGSSGIPLKILQDENKKLRNTADTIYFKGKAGFEVGDRLYYIRKWYKKYTHSRLGTWLRNIVMVDVTSFSEKYLADLINSLKQDRSTKTLLGYSSGYSEICKYLDSIDSPPIDSNITCVIAMAETLSDATRRSLEKYFKAPVISRYSNNENGILSMQLPGQGTSFHINWASYHIELLHPEHDTPVNYGDIGRVVVTDLFNYCMPIIRYDTGDLAIMCNEEKHFNHAPSFIKIEGRKMDVLFDTMGRMQSPHIVYHLESLPGVKQFQIVQESEKRYILKLNADQKLENEDKVIQIYLTYFGEDADIRVEYLTEIPQLSSGKRRLTVNNFLPEKHGAVAETEKISETS